MDGSRSKVIPPAPTWPRGEAAILREQTGAVGVALWQAARDIRLWAQTNASARSGLFRSPLGGSSRTPEAPELQRTFAELKSVVRQPERASAVEVAAAATEIARWAEGRQMLQTALEFAEGAALADPTSAAAAISAGRLARRAGEINRSAAWYRRAVRLARGDHDAYIRAQLGYGGVMLELGNQAEASVAFRRASRMAIKYGSRGLAAQANHELLVIARDAGTYEAGAAAAEKALERYPIRHPRLPDLAHHYAQLLIRAGYFRASLPILQELLAIVRPDERLWVRAELARSAGAVGERDLFEESCAEVVRDVSLLEDHAVHALLEVAAGARWLGEWELARRLGGDALEIATKSRAAGLALLAEQLLSDVDARSGGEQGLALEAPLPVQLTVSAFLRKLAKRGGRDSGG